MQRLAVLLLQALNPGLDALSGPAASASAVRNRATALAKLLDSNLGRCGRVAVTHPTPDSVRPHTHPSALASPSLG